MSDENEKCAVNADKNVSDAKTETSILGEIYTQIVRGVSNYLLDKLPPTLVGGQDCPTNIA